MIGATVPPALGGADGPACCGRDGAHARVNRALTVPSAGMEAMCSGLQVMPNSARSTWSSAVSTDGLPGRLLDVRGEGDGPGVAGHVEDSLALQPSGPAARAEVHVRPDE